MRELDTKSIWERHLSGTDFSVFLYQIIARAITSYQRSQFLDFDAQTKSRCCHGIALLVCQVIQQLQCIDLAKYNSFLKSICEQTPSHLQIDNILQNTSPIIMNLATLYLLNYTSTLSPEKGKFTDVKKLSNIAKTNKKFRENLVHSLQRHLSNVVADSYLTYASMIDDKTTIAGLPVSTWSKYVTSPYLRKDIRNVKYASNFFSMQILVAYLRMSEQKVGIIYDIVDGSGNIRLRNTWILQGKKSHFTLLRDMEKLNSRDPIIVLGGFAVSDALNLNPLVSQLHTSLQDLSSLILACDVSYPQFPEVSIDPNFDSSCIIPEEPVLQTLIEHYSSVPGLSIDDPSFFYLSHIFPLSIEEMTNHTESIPCNRLYIPEGLLSIPI